MYKLLIVDDEPAIRKGIATSINWEIYGIQIVGEAKNGKEALEMAKTTYPDILITDIRMPLMDGLEFCSLMQMNFPKTKKIILSGYDDFEYAKKAISYNVKEYLLKPVGAQQLIEVIKRITFEIDKENQIELEQMSTRNILNKNYFYIQSELLKKLMRISVNDRNYILSELEKLDIKFVGPFFWILIIEIDDYFKILSDKDYYQMEQFEMNARMCLQSEMGLYMHTTIGLINNNQYVCIVDEQKHDRNQLKKQLTEIIARLKEHYKLSISITVSPYTDDIGEFGELYEKALRQSIYKLYVGKGAIIMTSDYPDQTEISNRLEKLPYTNMDEQEINQLIMQQNELKLKAKIIELFNEFKRHYTSINQVIQVVIRIITITNRVLDFEGEQIEKYLKRNIIFEINQLETLDEIENWLMTYLKECLSLKIVNRFSNEINKSIQFIKNNYMTILTLEVVAKEVGLSVSYLSRLFKEETGYGFTDFINMERIEQAKKLLLDHQKSYQVANAVGFNDYKYFSKVFKKVTGVSPRDWLK